MRNVKIILEYDGTGYHGWQRQPNGITIQETLENAIHRITQEKVTLIGSGRTDAGVHAFNQVANFRTDSTIGCYNMMRGINSILPYDIVVKEASDVEGGFHARYGAKSKVYLYQICNRPVRPALLKNYSWHVYQAVDLLLMDKALRLLVGTKDFSSFCGADDDASNHVRTVMNTGIEKRGNDRILVTVEADGFLRHMVRNIIGLVVDVGKGILSLSEFSDIIEARDRTKAGVTAPPQGLFLMEVRY
jgi:tRNA pseudouridine38-40 synthase